MSIERVVAVLTPIFAALAAWLTGLIGAHFPGVHIDSNQIVALEIAGFTGATAAALKWLHGRQKFTELTADADKVRAELEKLKADVAANPVAGLALADIEALLKSHEAQIEQSINSHVPAAVGQALQALFSQLGGQPPQMATAVQPAPPPVAPPAV